MIKRVVIIIFCFTISKEASSQGGFFRGFGFYGAGTQSMHHYKNVDRDKRQYTFGDYAANPQYYSPQNHYSMERFSWGAGLFLEFGRSNNVRWQTELEYANKGAKEKELLDPLFGIRSDRFVANKYTYFQWNNYLKFFGAFGYAAKWYVMPGVRLEYLFRSSTPVYNPYSSNFPKFWFSGDIGVGTEYPFYKKWNWFVEYHYNPDVLRHKNGTAAIRNRTFELRLGLVFRPKQRSIDDCNAPKYFGPNY